jgi:hypothetical protein
MNFYLNSNDTLFKLYYLFINDSTITVGYKICICTILLFIERLQKM